MLHDRIFGRITALKQRRSLGGMRLHGYIRSVQEVGLSRWFKHKSMTDFRPDAITLLLKKASYDKDDGFLNRKVFR
jgi:hypothetical protein